VYGSVRTALTAAKPSAAASSPQLRRAGCLPQAEAGGSHDEQGEGDAPALIPQQNVKEKAQGKT